MSEKLPWIENFPRPINFRIRYLYRKLSMNIYPGFGEVHLLAIRFLYKFRFPTSKTMDLRWPLFFVFTIVSVLKRAVNCEPSLCAATRRAEIRFFRFSFFEIICIFSIFSTMSENLPWIENCPRSIKFRSTYVYQKLSMNIYPGFGEVHLLVIRFLSKFRFPTSKIMDLRWPLFFVFATASVLLF